MQVNDVLAGAIFSMYYIANCSVEEIITKLNISVVDFITVMKKTQKFQRGMLCGLYVADCFSEDEIYLNLRYNKDLTDEWETEAINLLSKQGIDPGKIKDIGEDESKAS